MTLPLNTRAQDQEQQVDISVVILPDYTTVGRPHGTDATSPAASAHQRQRHHRPHDPARTTTASSTARRDAFRPDELIHNAKTRRKES